QIPHFKGMIAAPDGAVIGFRGRQMVRFAPPFNQAEPIAVLPGGWKQRLGAVRLMARLLRLEVYRMVRTPLGTDIATSSLGILRRAAKERTFRTIFRDFRGSRPISLCTDAQGRVYFGEYFDNPEREEVRVFVSGDDGNTWRAEYTFSPKSIRHVHGIEYDAQQDRIWVMTGDYGDESQIGVAAPGFAEYRAIAKGSQQTRACAGVCRAGELLYATDTPLEQNHVYRLNAQTGQRTPVADVQQSVFFMGQACGGYFLSTIVEPSPVHTTKSVHVWFSPDGDAWGEVFSAPRDRWSLRYFQYPAAFIAQSERECPYVFLSFRAVRGLDDACLVGRIY
ncbi:MAG: hypothetical protein WD468_02940, partial [Pirellulales bacterium]